MIVQLSTIGVLAVSLACTPSPHLTPTEVTCNEFAVYQSHPTKGNLEKLLTDSFRLPGYGKPGLVSDIGQLYADASGGGSKYVPGDIEYIRDDCGGAN